MINEMGFNIKSPWPISIFLVCFSISTAWAGPAAYLDFDPAARPSGMGSAFTALVDDPSALTFNPAGLTNMDANNFEAVGSVGILSQDQFNNYLGMSGQLEHKNFIGFDLIEYGVGNVFGENTDGLFTATLEDLELSFSGSYAYDFDYHLKAGFRSGFLYQDLTGVQARGFEGVDLGFLYVPTALYDFTLGASIRHLGGFLAWDTGTNQSLAPDLRLGACLKLFEQWLTLAYDAEKSFQNGTNFLNRVGGEIWVEKIAAVRGGIDNGNPTVGASVRVLNYGLDYSYEFEINGLGDIQRISADVIF